MGTLSARLGSGIKSIQKGTENLTGSGTSATKTITLGTTINAAKSVVFFNSYMRKFPSTTVSADISAIVLNNTNITLTKTDGTTGWQDIFPSSYLHWQVIEYY